MIVFLAVLFTIGLAVKWNIEWKRAKPLITARTRAGRIAQFAELYNMNRSAKWANRGVKPLDGGRIARRRPGRTEPRNR